MQWNVTTNHHGFYVIRFLIIRRFVNKARKDKLNNTMAKLEVQKEY